MGPEPNDAVGEHSMENKLNRESGTDMQSSADQVTDNRKPYSRPELTHYGDMSALTRIGTAGGPEDFIYGGGPPS